jgi:hypothetical protein
MHQLISAALGAAILSGSIVYHIATTHFEIVTPLTEWFLNRNSFTFLFYIVSASIGIVFMTAGRRGSEVDEHMQKHGDSITTFYASAGGSIFGWATGICIAAVLANPVRYWLFATLVVLMAAFVVAAPLIGMTLTRRMVSEFNNRWFRQQWREPYVRLLGGTLLATSIVFLVYDLQT